MAPIYVCHQVSPIVLPRGGGRADEVRGARRPMFMLTRVGWMKRPDLRLAWQGKLAIAILIFILNAIIIFYIIEFRRLLFSLRINQYKKGPLVSEKKDILAQARDQDIQRVWDTGATPSTALTTTSIRLASIGTTAITTGQDSTKSIEAVMTKMNPAVRARNKNYLRNAVFVGKTDFRKTPRREESLRRRNDSLAAWHCDNKRKLIFVICDDNIIGSGKDRTTLRIVSDTLGVPEGRPNVFWQKLRRIAG
ncbi:glycosyltransferase family 2 protein [Pleurotus ostreatus PC15]|uniref:Glycosyltransferase family 2 protein n=1 Tax=Pleurotus ostreatus (strain PC15) TaxID=1137138 RepID=A0A067NDW8_PLEO1|nr:glycosyltransferase family 2 protein [Pleurotus ostreatus PC15]